MTASERDPWERARFRVQIADPDAANIIVLDACSSNRNLTRHYARAPRGERAIGVVPRNTPPNTTLIATMHLGGMGPAMIREGGTDSAAFTVFLEQVLGPTLQPGQIVVLDNLSVHKSAHVQEVLAARGCHVWFLPTYSPDLSPIELAFAKLKAYLRQIGARTVDALEHAIREGIARITAEEARQCFAHCGYRVMSETAQHFCSLL